MGRGKKKNAPDFYATIGNDIHFGRIYESMAKSPPYMALSIGARHFYTLCRVQAQSPEAKKCLYEHGKQFDRHYSENCFVFPAKHLAAYGYDHANAKKYFEQLIEAGFIEMLEKNNVQRLVNVYAFSDKWKSRRPGP